MTGSPESPLQDRRPRLRSRALARLSLLLAGRLARAFGAPL